MSAIGDLLDDLDSDAVRPSVTVRLVLGRAVALVDEWERLETDLARAGTGTDDSLESDLHDLAELVQAKETEIDAAMTEFRFVSIGPKPWKDLVAEHPPTPADLKADPRAEVNPRTFFYAAIAASCQTPPMTVDEAERLYSSPGMSDGQWEELRAACLKSNVARYATPKSHLAGSILRASERSATTAAAGASLDLSSLDGS